MTNYFGKSRKELTYPSKEDYYEIVNRCDDLLLAVIFSSQIN